MFKHKLLIMKKIILSAAVIAFGGILSAASANSFTNRDTASFSRDTASFKNDTALFVGDTASFNQDTALFAGDTAQFRDTALFAGDTAQFRDTALFAGDTAQFRDTASFAGGTAQFRDTASFNHDTARFAGDTAGARVYNDTTALAGDSTLFRVQNDSTQKVPVKLEALPEPVKSTLQSGELKQWSPSAAFMVRTDTSAYYQVYVQKGTEGKNVNIDEKGAVLR